MKPAKVPSPRPARRRQNSAGLDDRAERAGPLGGAWMPPPILEFGPPSSAGLVVIEVGKIAHPGLRPEKVMEEARLGQYVVEARKMIIRCSRFTSAISKVLSYLIWPFTGE